MLIAIQFDVVVVVIDRVDESPAFIHFVGMLVGSCFKELLLITHYSVMSRVYITSILTTLTRERVSR